MSRFSFSPFLIVLCLVLSAPDSLAAGASADSSTPAQNSSWSLLSRLWSLAFWWGEEGCTIDPNGGCRGGLAGLAAKTAARLTRMATVERRAKRSAQSTRTDAVKEPCFCRARVVARSIRMVAAGDNS